MTRQRYVFTSSLMNKKTAKNIPRCSFILYLPQDFNKPIIKSAEMNESRWIGLNLYLFLK